MDLWAVCRDDLSFRTLIVNFDTTSSSSPTAPYHLEMIHGDPSFGHETRDCPSELWNRDTLKMRQLWPIFIISKQAAQEW
jgi:hypothetical protein